MNRFTIALLFLSFFTTSAFSQEIKLTPGKGFDEIKIGNSMESVLETLGFGKKKSYSTYIAEELFDRNSEETLECLIGFDHYIKYEYLLTLPVHFIYFKDNKVVQIKSTSFRDYYQPICENVVIGNGIKYWMGIKEMKSIIGEEETYDSEDYLILDTYHYFTKGISISAREKEVREVHVYTPQNAKNTENLTGKLKQ